MSETMTDPALSGALAGLMGWEETQKIGDLTITNSTFYFSHPTDGILVGVAQFAAELDGEQWYYRSWRPWRPLESMDDAMMVVERMQELDWRCHMKNWHISKDWMVTFACGAAEHSITDRPCSRAICRAALAAIGVEVA